MSTTLLRTCTREVSKRSHLQLGYRAPSYGEAREDMLGQSVWERYRCPEDFLHLSLSGELSSDRGYFKFGPKAICYGGGCCRVFPAAAARFLSFSLPGTKISEGRVRPHLHIDEI